MSNLGRQFDPELHAMVEKYRSTWTGVPGGFAAGGGEKMPAEHVYGELKAQAASYDPQTDRIFIRNHVAPSHQSQQQWHEHIAMLQRHISGPENAHLNEPPRTVRSDFGPRLEAAAVDRRTGRRIPIHVYPAPY